jgi:hypothetical protein
VFLPAGNFRSEKKVLPLQKRRRKSLSERPPWALTGKLRRTFASVFFFGIAKRKGIAQDFSRL